MVFEMSGTGVMGKVEEDKRQETCGKEPFHGQPPFPPI
jgi:hypothetical protein